MRATQDGGTLGGGTLDETDPSTGATVKIVGNSAGNALPQGSLALLSDGFIYGVTEAGGGSGNGSIFDSN